MQEVLFHNAKIHTQDAVHPSARWLWVCDGVLLTVGLDEASLSSVPPEVHRVDLGGRTLVPGFVDAHVHLTWIATSVLGPNLAAAGDIEELLETVRGWDRPGRGPDDMWIVGDGFDETTWGVGRLPVRQQLDAACKDRPVLVKRVCGHVGALNSTGVERARTLVATHAHLDPSTGRIVEDALWELNRHLRPSLDALIAAVPGVVRRLHECGVTAVHDVASVEMLQALAEVASQRRLDLELSFSLPLHDMDAFEGSKVARQAAAQGLRFLGPKLFVDGSLGGRTAFLRSSYADDASTRGVMLHTRADLAARVARADDCGWQLMVHTIGDAALELALDVLEPLTKRGNDRRHRVEHVEVTPPELAARLGTSQLWACVQPNFAGRWSQPGGMNEQRLGARLAHCNAYRTLLAHDVKLAFGSDCMPLGPLYGLRSAVHHPVAAESLAPATALALYTVAAAELVGQGARFGRLAPGLAANFVLLNGDPLGNDLDTLRVVATFVAGRQVSGQIDAKSKLC